MKIILLFIFLSANLFGQVGFSIDQNFNLNTAINALFDIQIFVTPKIDTIDQFFLTTINFSESNKIFFRS